MAKLSFDTYGKTDVRLTYVSRTEEKHEVRELNVNLFFEGDFGAAYTSGDNSNVLPTDTMKNTVYVLAKQLRWKDIETFARGISGHFLARVSPLKQIRVEIFETPWEPIDQHSTVFQQARTERRITKLIASRSERICKSGFKNLQILKTAHSAFAGFAKDEFTTLPETHDRLFGTLLSAEWTYRQTDIDFNAHYQSIRKTLLDTFAEHHSHSVQHTLFAMAEAVLRTHETIDDAHLTIPNKHLLPVDLGKFGLENPNQIFVPTDEPSGFIEAQVSR